LIGNDLLLFGKFFTSINFMSIREISKYELNRYNIDKNPMAEIFSTEKKWYVTNDNKLIGIVLQDNIDKDWSSLILALESDGVYRAIDVVTSIEAIDKAENDLFQSINNLLIKGQKEETLFASDEEEKPLSLIVTDIDEEIKKYFNKHPEKLYDLNPRKFEELIASILKDLGFDVELTKATRDGGRDIIASIRTKVTTFLTYVECKRYSPDNKIDVRLIREVLGVHAINKPAKSIIVFYQRGY
ncbi:MAG TPA: restriction endonuclease, partial [Candidatus Dojkabacteria bacterium]|nr:restriction endonuclease [Candidatus Dojkabacteria bacterium]